MVIDQDAATAVAKHLGDTAPHEALSHLSTDEAMLIVQGLFALRERKVEAFSVVQATGLACNGQRLAPRDFGIPQIDDLLQRFDAS